MNRLTAVTFRQTGKGLQIITVSNSFGMFLFSGGESTQLVSKWLYSGYILVAECLRVMALLLLEEFLFKSRSFCLESESNSLILISVHVDGNRLAVFAD